MEYRVLISSFILYPTQHFQLSTFKIRPRDSRVNTCREGCIARRPINQAALSLNGCYSASPVSVHCRS
jgi:hypothetical protein